MCTRVLWTGFGDTVIVGRNMDWAIDMGTCLWVMPRGASRTGLTDDPRPLEWTAEYGSVIATSYDIATSDGLNEAGLAAHLLWLAESDFGPRDTAVPGVAMSMWAQYHLDTCATVGEAVARLASSPVQPRPQVDAFSGKTSTVHLALDDATGDSAVIEYVDGAPHVYHGREHTVMTNSPPFDEQLAHLKQYEGFGGDRRLPGTTEAADRFVRARYYTDRLPEPASRAESYAGVLSVMRNAAQPFGTPDPVRPNVSRTIWRTLADLTNRVYAFESAFRPDIVWTDLADLDFTGAARLDPRALPMAGSVNGRYSPADPFAFAMP